MPFVDSRHLLSTLHCYTLDLVFFLSTLDFFTLDFLLSAVDFYSRLSTFTLDSPLFTLDSRHLLSTLHFLLSTLDFYSRLSTFTLDFLLSTLDIYSRLSTFRYTRQSVIALQLVWKTSQELGVGVATGKMKIIQIALMSLLDIKLLEICMDNLSKCS